MLNNIITLKTQDSQVPAEADLRTKGSASTSLSLSFSLPLGEASRESTFSNKNARGRASSKISVTPRKVFTLLHSLGGDAFDELTTSFLLSIVKFLSLSD